MVWTNRDEHTGTTTEAFEELREVRFWSPAESILSSFSEASVNHGCNFIGVDRLTISSSISKDLTARLTNSRRIASRPMAGVPTAMLQSPWHRTQCR